MRPPSFRSLQSRPRARSLHTSALLRPSSPPSLHPSSALTPFLLIVQIGGITTGTCLVPLIGARNASSRAGNSPEDSSASQSGRGVVVTVTPTGQQLLKLAQMLRKQLSQSGTLFEAAFTVRQLHMTNLPQLPPPPPPQLLAPAQFSSNSTSPENRSTRTLPEVRAEKWLWRLPAAVAIHGILRHHHRQIQHPTQNQQAQSLLPLAAQLALNALHWDVLLFGALLRSLHAEAPLADPSVAASVRPRWAQLYRLAKADSVELGLREKLLVDASLPRRERVGEPLEGEDAREQRRRERVEYLWSRVAPLPALPERLPAAKAELAPVSPLVSLPRATLEALFLALAHQTRETAPVDPHAAVSLSFALGALGRNRSSAMLSRTFRICMDFNRRDLAARTLAEWMFDSSASVTARRAAFGRLKEELRPLAKGWRADPGKKTLAAVAHLVRALDRAWAQAKENGWKVEDKFAPLENLIPLLASFPPGPVVTEVEPGTGRALRARAQDEVFLSLKNLLRGVLEDVTGRRIELLARSVKVGPPLALAERTLPLSVPTFNSLISYALNTLDSPELAVPILSQMRAQGLRPTPATQNILLGLVRKSADELVDEYKAARDSDLPSVRMGQAVVRSMVQNGEWDVLDRVVFAVLPELDIEITTPTRSATASEAGDAKAVFDPRKGPDAPARPDFAKAPPSTALEQEAAGRSPGLYITLLTALRDAGRIGLAERVFRNARWAAELSRRHKGPHELVQGWVLPPKIYVVMLQLYANEARKGRSVGRQIDAEIRPASSPYVLGWGRHALRVFLLSQRAAEIQARLGETHDTRTWRSSRSRELPPILRAEAATLVAKWELQGGSKGQDLVSLQRAIKSPEAERALAELFPDQVEQLAEMRQRRREVEGGQRVGRAGGNRERQERRARQMRRRSVGGRGRGPLVVE